MVSSIVFQLSSPNVGYTYCIQHPCFTPKENHQHKICFMHEFHSFLWHSLIPPHWSHIPLLTCLFHILWLICSFIVPLSCVFIPKQLNHSTFSILFHSTVHLCYTPLYFDTAVTLFLDIITISCLLPYTFPNAFIIFSQFSSDFTVSIS